MMKKRIVIFFAAALAVTGVWADEWTDPDTGYTWTYRINGDTAEIYNNNISWSTAILPKPTGSVTIPSALGGKPVTCIGDFAFRDCSGLTSVTIPNGVTSIGEHAFCFCSGLTSVTIPASVTTIGWSAFSPCSGLLAISVSEANPRYKSVDGLLLSKDGTSLIQGVNGDVTIPNSVTSIEDYAFSGCSGLTSVTIGNGVTSIGHDAFSGCSGLTSVTIGNGVTSIGDYAFSSCSRLTSVTIPDSVTDIGWSAFSGCSDSLFDITTIPGVKLVDGWAVGNTGSLSGHLNLKGIRGIGPGAFRDCSGLTNVTIPDSVTSIGGSAFSGCSGLTSVTIPQCVMTLKDTFPSSYQSIRNVVVQDGVMSIGVRAFSGCSGLKSVTIPNSVTNIGDNAFSGCRDLTSVTIPNSVTSIGWEAFAGCSGLTSVMIGNGVTSIGDYAFSWCSGLTSVTIPNSVTNIGGGAFWGCSGLMSVTIPDSVTSIGRGAFEDCSGLTSATIPESVKHIGPYALRSCTNLTSVTIPSSVTSIEYSAFEYCSGLTSVTIPDSVTRIEKWTFAYCESLTSVTIPNSVRYIEDNAFRDSIGLTSVYVSPGDAERVKGLMRISGFDVDHVTFIEDGGTSDSVTSDSVTPGAGASGARTTAPETPNYGVIDEKDIVAPYEAPKAVALQGVVYDGGKVVGIVELKLGKVNAKKKTSKVFGSFIGLDGKKITIKAVNVTGVDSTAPVTVSLEVKGHGTMTVTIGGEQFAGAMGKYHVQSAVVGGSATGTGTKVYVDATSASLPAGVLEELLPDGEPVVASGGKWKFAKAASVKWAKPKKGAARPEIYDEASGKGLVVNTSAGKTNLSGLKLTYTPKKGTFKGSFKVYALEGSGKATKLKKYTVKVSGVVVGGFGYGTATCKKPAMSWAVTVK